MFKKMFRVSMRKTQRNTHHLACRQDEQALRDSLSGVQSAFHSDFQNITATMTKFHAQAIDYLREALNRALSTCEVGWHRLADIVCALGQKTNVFHPQKWRYD